MGEGSHFFVGQPAELAEGASLFPWWNDISPDLIRFKSLHLPFSKEFPTEHHTLYSQSSLDVMNMKDTTLLKVIML